MVLCYGFWCALRARDLKPQTNCSLWARMVRKGGIAVCVRELDFEFKEQGLLDSSTVGDLFVSYLIVAVVVACLC